MNNKLLQNHSNIFQSDQDDRVEQKCFMLFSGSKTNEINQMDHLSNAFSIDLFFENPDNPDHK